MKALFAAAALACIITLSGCESRSLNENSASCAPGRAAPAPQAAAGNGKTPEIQKPGQNDKAARFKAMLANRESVEKDDRYVYTANGTERIGLVEQFMWNVERNKPGRLTGYLAGGTVPIAYEFTYTPDSGVLFLSYNDHLGLNEYAVTDIYEHPLFYHFTDNKEFYFSIPKADFVFSAKTPIEGYVAGMDLKAGGPALNPLTAQQAIDTAIETDAALDVYFENGGSYCGYGIIVPETIASDADVSKPGKIADAVSIQGARYYKVIIPPNPDLINAGDMHMVPEDIYYVSADDSTIFLESMVAGELVPIGYKDVQHLQPNG